MKPTVVLFDIDGTLIHGAGAGRVAMEAGFADVVGDAEPLRALRFAGMTDPAIVRHGLEALGPVPPDDARIAAVLGRYLARLPEAIAGTAGYRLLPGVETLLARLIDGSGLAVGLGTGNVERGARLKLTPLAVAERFTFGGFGSDAEDRAELLAVGRRRGAARLARSPEQCRVVVVGDTPKDVAAALAVGAQCLAVATSIYDGTELREAGATWVVDDLTDARSWSFITGETGP